MVTRRLYGRSSRIFATKARPFLSHLYDVLCRHDETMSVFNIYPIHAQMAD